ncbi:LysR substrate-binding domain-containing protein [Roseobacter sp. SK209-2-6]|uniref:LysR substrate-binding domain-containing protein n=1 Tax=Roseobacter sp. SK209-2-6 TaxID=388739 RepID=UPI000A016E43|nr:LysR substrate-binding domain-containing protein [Roseobacter sp. SK209-2-6]
MGANKSNALSQSNNQYLALARVLVIGHLAMSRSFPPLIWLRAFEATARHLSFTHAAQELNLTQAAVSKQVKLLESYLKAPLFVRHARSIEITRVGQAYLPVVNQAFEDLAYGTHELFSKGPNDALTIRTSIGFGVLWLAHNLHDFQNHHPDIKLRIISNVWNENSSEGHCDLDIRYGDGEWPGLRVTQLTRDALFPACHPGLLASGALQNLASLREQTLIHVIGYAEGWSNWLREAKLDCAGDDKCLHVDTNNLGFEILTPTFGVILTRSSLARQRLATGSLAKPFSLEIPAQENFYLTQHETAIGHPDAKLFSDWLLARSNQP